MVRSLFLAQGTSSAPLTAAKTIDRAVKDIETAAAGIRAGRFPADPAYQACLYCPYRSICPRGEGE